MTRTCQRVVAAVVLSCLVWMPPLARCGDAPAATQPITTARGPVGDLLRKWWAEGTAAGNIGDYYDNRDREHSGLNMAPYPQLSKVTYTKEQLDRRADWAAQHVILPHVTFGNSSTSATVLQGGSNVRRYYTSTRGLQFLFTQYVRNNLYIYPEHRDHDPGHNGPDGYGDLFPTNTPYLICSQGSSGSDQPFMRAMPFVLAAFRPEVKKKLVETGLLMPTVQMIFRSCNKHLSRPEEYFTGKAHPTVFEGAWVDDLKMVQMAHEITLQTIPPFAQMRVVEEDTAVNGRDFFEPAGATEKHADTPAVVARIWRSVEGRRRMVVSAEASFDINKRPLTWRWAVLRGDPSRITITAKNPEASIVEIVLRYHERRPVAEGSPLESNRVDIGLFVNNGAYWSPPAFLTFFGIDSECRTYASDGRAVEVGYGMGGSEVSISNWPGLFEALRADSPPAGAALLKKALKPGELADIAAAETEYREAFKALALARETEKTAQQKAKEAAEAKLPEPVRKKAEADARAAAEAAKSAAGAVDQVLARKRPHLPGGVKGAVEGWLKNAVADPMFLAGNAALLESLSRSADAAGRNAIATARKRLAGYGVIDAGEGALRLTPVLARPGEDGESLTRYEKAMLQRFNGEVLVGVGFRGVATHTWKTNYVDPAISAPKTWRDVYRYDAAGKRTGWTRYDGQNAIDFDAEGRAVVEKDPAGRPLRTRAVRYEPEPAPAGAGEIARLFRPLRWVMAD